MIHCSLGEGEVYCGCEDEVFLSRPIFEFLCWRGEICDRCQGMVLDWLKERGCGVRS